MSLINTTVIMSGADYFSNQQPINPYYADETIDLAQATAEHQAIQTAFGQAGINVQTVPPPSDSQDGVYTANWALVRGGKAVLARLPEARKAEEAYAHSVLTGYDLEVITPPEGLKFSGQGDALACGDYLFCGSGYRSDEAAQEFAADQLGYTRIQLQTVPQRDDSGTPMINTVSGWADSFYYDIDLALAIIKGPSGDSNGLIAYCPEAFLPDSLHRLEQLENFDKIIVSESEAREAFACNLVSTGEAVVMSAYAPQLRQELEARGLHVITPEITELAKGGGYIRCTSLSLTP